MEKTILEKAIWANFPSQLEIAIEYDILFLETGDKYMENKCIDLVHNLIFDFIDFLGLDGTDESIVHCISNIVFEQIEKNGYFKNFK